LHGPNREHRFEQYSYCCVFTDPLFRSGFFYCCMRVHLRGNLFTESLPSNELFRFLGLDPSGLPTCPKPAACRPNPSVPIHAQSIETRSFPSNPSFGSQILSKLAQAVTLAIYIGEASGPNLGQDDYLYRCSMVFLTPSRPV
jgi:hypothetical protein